MIYPLTDLNCWPLRDNGEPIFQSTNDAFLYAQLIYDLPEKQDLLDTYRHRAFSVLKFIREGKDPDLQAMMDLAVRAQSFRECLEECQRIKAEKVNTPGV